MIWMRLVAIAWYSGDPHLCAAPLSVCAGFACVCVFVWAGSACVLIHLWFVSCGHQVCKCHFVFKLHCMFFCLYICMFQSVLVNISICMCCCVLSFTLAGYSQCPLAAPSSPFTVNPTSVIGSYMTECMQNAPAPFLSACVVLSCSLNTDWQANMHLI